MIFDITIYYYTCCVTDAPIHTLRPIFLYLKTHPEYLHSAVDDILDSTNLITLAETPSLTLRPWTEGTDPTMRSGFRQSLKRHLLGSRDLTALRLRLALVDFVWVIH